MYLRRIFVAMLLVLASPSLLAEQFVTGALTIDKPWSLEGPPTAFNGAVYLMIKNGGVNADQIIGGKTPVADKVELHTHVHENGLMKMKQVNSVEIPSGEMTMFKPGGNHVMLLGLNKSLKAGDEFPVTLQFQQSQEIEVMVTVVEQGEMPMHSGHSQ